MYSLPQYTGSLCPCFGKHQTRIRDKTAKGRFTLRSPNGLIWDHYILYGLYASLAGFLCQRQALHWSCLRRRRWGPLLTMVGGLIDLGLCSLDRIQDKKKELHG